MPIGFKFNMVLEPIAHSKCLVWQARLIQHMWRWSVWQLHLVPIGLKLKCNTSLELKSIGPVLSIL